MKSIINCNKKSLKVLKIKCLLRFDPILWQNRRYNSELKTYLSDFGAKHPQKKCEKFWTEFWQKNRLFSESMAKKNSHFHWSTKEQHFSVLLPPPNITGSLHLGHALTLSIEDAICRYHRMNGYTVRWIPGLDHAGIATQLMVEKMLWTKHQKTRHDLTREQFLSEVNEWKDKRSEEIREQLSRLGVGLDFENQFYTLSDEMSDAVTEAFVRLFNSGQIHRRSLAVNWSFYLRSTISDIEVEHKQITGPTHLSVPGFDGKVLVGVMHRFNYPIEGKSDVISMATTRLETILGDVAVAVHPEDSRYSHLIGVNVVNPFNGRRMPIIADESVRPDFGTGAVKITPGHSAVDYAVAEKHSLPVVDIFDDFGRLYCPELPQFHGLHRFEAKEVIQKELQNKGLYLDQSDHKHSIPLCSRSGDLIESRRVPQWFLRCDKQSVLAKFAVNRDYMSESDEQNWNQFKEQLCEEDKYISIVPPNYRIVWKEWFSRYEDWCISRQISWGHRIPAFNVIKDGQTTDEWIAAKSESEALMKAKNSYPSHEITVRQDPDVLDTWFSSALLPLSINGWPKQELNADTFPLSLMETGHDIIFFWVARMVIMSIALTNKLPFRRVLLHGMVCDANGKKMSKSKGNVIDPIDIIDGISLKQLKQKYSDYYESGVLSKTQLDQSLAQLTEKFPKGIIDCGADALRYYLLQTDFKAENVLFNVQHVVLNRNFCNKMHQTVRFFLSNIGPDFSPNDPDLLISDLTAIDRWILSSLVDMIKTCNQSFASYDLQLGAQAIRHFWQNQFCDIYLEYSKQFIYNETDIYRRDLVLNVLTICLLTSLRAIHPFMPFISENLWQHLMQTLFPDRVQYKSICDECYPDLTTFTDQLLNEFDIGFKTEMPLVEAIVQKIRWFKQNFKVTKNLFENNILIAINGNYLEKYQTLIEKSAKISGIRFISIHDIHNYDKHLCYKIMIENNSDISGDETVEEGLHHKNSFDDCYLLLDIDCESLLKTMSESGVNSEIIEQKSNELNEYKCNNFHKNFWKTKSLKEELI